MNAEVIEYMCKSQAILLNIPTRLYFERKLILSFEANTSEIEIDLLFPYLDQLFNTDQLINYCITPEMLLVGIVKDNSSPYSMIIGPMCIGQIPDTTIRKIITSRKYHFNLEHLSQLSSYLSKLKIVHIQNFIALLSLLCTNLNHKIIPLDQIIKPDAEYDIESDIEHSMLEKDEKTSFHGLKRRNSYDYESEMLFCIRHGMTSHLKQMEPRGLLIQAGTLAFDSLRHYKNSMIILNSLSIRAAMAGGLDQETCYQLGEIYIQKIESCMDIKQLAPLGKALRIDYCERVRALLHPHSDDLIINKAMHYISENVHKKITASEIAALLPISKEYLSTRFKQITGVSMSNYITSQKMLEAKRLLRLTDKPLSEISEYLAFSSQSYFQNIFKKTEGITPLAYRNTPKEKIVSEYT